MAKGFGRKIGIGAVALACVLLLIHCGSSSSPSNEGARNTSPPDNSVTLSSTVVNMAAGQTYQFSALVGGSSSTAVTWSVSPASGTGNIGQIATISSSGLLQVAGNAPAIVLMVTATGTADSSSIASATVTVIPPGTVAATNNPLVAKYSIAVPRQATVAIQFGPDTNYGLKTWTQPTPTDGSPISMFVAGMKQNTAYHMSAMVQFSDGSNFADPDHTFTTGSVPASRIPNFTVTSPNNLTPSGGVELFDGVNPPPGSNYVPAGATDLQGNLIWYFDYNVPPPPSQYGDFVNPFKLLPNGNFIVVIGAPDGGMVPPDSAGATLFEIDLAGDVIWQLTIGQLNQRLAGAGYNLNAIQFHHDVLPLPSGHIIALVNSTRTFNDLPGYPGPTLVLGNALVDLDQNLQPVWVWDEFDHLDVNRHPMSFPDWTHTNAVIYSPSDGDLIVSMRHQNWIVKVNYDDGKGNGDIVWRLGEGGDFKLQGGTDPIDWFYAQHAVHLLSQNSRGIYKIGLFDNGNDRIVDQNGDVCGSPGVQACYSTVAILQMNEAAKTATIVWRDTLPIFSFFGGYMQLFPNGNVEFDASAWGNALSQVMEVTQQKTPTTVWQMDESPLYLYRAFRIPSLYPGVTW
ncbi:MAG: aryl-sulfate sulfotransferase [Terriglobia bacterium]